MSAPQESGNSVFSVRAIAIMLTIALVSFSAVVVLSGWAPELRKRDTAGAHPFSTSALGFNGLFKYLEALGYPVSISQHDHLIETRSSGLMIITLEPSGSLLTLNATPPTGKTLIVLPKWRGDRDAFNMRRQGDTQLLDRDIVVSTLIGLDQFGGLYDPAPYDEIYTEDGVPVEEAPPDTPASSEFEFPDEVFDADEFQSPVINRRDVKENEVVRFGGVSLRPDLTLQTLQSDRLVPVIANGNDMLLAKTPYAETYILADPDIFHTFGLKHYENARLATQIIDQVRGDPAEPIYMDASLHGFQLSNNLLRIAFDIPFLGASLIGVAAALLLGWAALIRFGPALREARAIALGKEALADNSAALFTMARRETEIAKGYLSLIRKRAARDVNAPRTMQDADLSALFDKLGPENQSGKTFSQMEAGFDAPLTSRDDLMNKTRALFRWRRDVIGSKSNGNQ